jgi:hypothetical protein
MPPSREPILHPVALKDLRPTQITVGMREVKAKRKQWRAHDKSTLGDYLGRHMIPGLLGPNQRYYVIDHHHLARALFDEGVKDILVHVIGDLSTVHKHSFWIFLDHHGWCHPYDDAGKRRDFDNIPESIADLVDDPFRSLAGEVRRAGGFAKEATPFVEFVWADFLRRRIKRKDVDKDFAAALALAVKLAKSRDSDYMPGWCGPA